MRWLRCPFSAQWSFGSEICLLIQSVDPNPIIELITVLAIHGAFELITVSMLRTQSPICTGYINIRDATNIPRIIDVPMLDGCSGAVTLYADGCRSKFTLAVWAVGFFFFFFLFSLPTGPLTCDYQLCEKESNVHTSCTNNASCFRRTWFRFLLPSVGLGTLC